MSYTPPKKTLQEYVNQFQEYKNYGKTLVIDESKPLTYCKHGNVYAYVKFLVSAKTVKDGYKQPTEIKKLLKREHKLSIRDIHELAVKAGEWEFTFQNLHYAIKDKQHTRHKQAMEIYNKYKDLVHKSISHN